MTARRTLGVLLPVALGLGLAAWLISTAEPPPRRPGTDRTVTARTVVAQAKPVRPIARGYGEARPARSWQAVAEVAGAVVERIPELETGNRIAEGTTVLRIDPTAHELAVAEARAELASLKAERRQLDREAANTERLLALERDRLALAERELERVRGLVAEGTAPAARRDSQERATLAVRRAVTELSNTLGLIPDRKARLDAQVSRAEQRLARARRDLSKTEITAPFDLRVAEVHVERYQFAGTGQPLVSGDGTATAEITAQVPLADFPRLIGAAGPDGPAGPGARQAAFDAVDVEVRLVADPDQSWEGRLLRVENALDPQARSVPAVVAVDAPYAGARPPVRLPLVPNMYVEVRLRGPAGRPRVSLPDSAVHAGETVYLRDADGRLELRDVSVAWRQQGRAILDGGVEPGEEVILDDIVPAIPGLRVRPAGAGNGADAAPGAGAGP
jgi:RND family efflux transporter MFP subunit